MSHTLYDTVLKLEMGATSGQTLPICEKSKVNSFSLLYSILMNTFFSLRMTPAPITSFSICSEVSHSLIFMSENLGMSH